MVSFEDIADGGEEEAKKQGTGNREQG